MDDDDNVLEMNIEGMDPMEQVCRRLEAVANDQGWDAKPTFYALSILIDDDVPADIREKVQAANGPDYDAAMAVTEIVLPEFCYENPGEGLPLFLQCVIDVAVMKENDVDPEDVMHLLDRMVPQNFYGFGIVFEGWTLPDSVSEEEMKQRSHDHTVNEHPDRIEMRNLIMMTRNKRTAIVVHKRGDFPEYKELGPEVGRLAGRVPDAVQKITFLFEQFDDFRNGRVDVSQFN